MLLFFAKLYPYIDVEKTNKLKVISLYRHHLQCS